MEATCAHLNSTKLESCCDCMASQCMQPTPAQGVSLRRHQLSPTMGGEVSLRQHRQRQRLRKTLLVRAEADVAEQFAAIEKTGPDFKPLKDVQAIMDVLPHRCVPIPTTATTRSIPRVHIAAFIHQDIDSRMLSVVFLSCWLIES